MLIIKYNQFKKLIISVIVIAIMLTLHIPLAANASNDTEKTPCYLDFSGF